MVVPRRCGGPFPDSFPYRPIGKHGLVMPHPVKTGLNSALEHHTVTRIADKRCAIWSSNLFWALDDAGVDADGLYVNW